MANSAIVGFLRAIFTAETAQFDQALKRSTQVANEWAKDLRSIGSQATRLGSTLTTSLTLPIAGFGAATAKLAIDFQTSFAGVAKTVDGVSDDFGNLTAVGQQMAQGFRDLSKEIPINVNSLNAVGQAAGQLGIKRENIIGFTEVIAKLGVTTNLTAEQGALDLARLANITQMPQTNFERLGSTIVALGNHMATTEQDIVNFALRIAGAGHQVGLTEPQILAIGSALSSVGIEAEAGGTAISKVMIDISKAVANGGEKLASFAEVAGVSADQFAQKFKTDAAGALVTFIEGLARVKEEGGNTFQVLADLGENNIRVRDALLRAAGAGDKMRYALELGSQAWRDNTALTREAQIRFSTIASQLTLLWNKLKDVGITLGQALMPAMELLIRAANKLVPYLADFARLVGQLPAPLVLAAAGVAALVAAAGPLIYAFGQIAFAAGGMAAAFTKTGIATKALQVSGINLTGTLTVLGQAAAVVGVAMAGWQIGRLIEQHDMLRKTLAMLIPGLQSIELARENAIKKERELTEAIKDETIARAKQAGVMITSTDRASQYQQAIDGLAKAADIQTAKAAASALAQRDAEAATVAGYTAVKNATVVLQEGNLDRQAYIDLQIKGAAAELALGRVSQQTYNAKIASLTADKDAAEVAKSRISISEAIAIAEKKVQGEISATGYTVAELVTWLRKNETGFKAYATSIKLPSDAMQFLESQVRSQIDAEKKAKDAAEDHAKALEKIATAANSLGAVTQSDVIEGLADLLDIEKHLTDQGNPLAATIGLLYPKLEELAKSAAASGISVNALAASMERARGVLSVAIPSFSLPISTAAESMALLARNGIDMSRLMTVAQYDAQHARDAMKELGVTSQEELRATADSARASYEAIARDRGAFSREGIEAHQKMVDAQLKASGQLPTYYQRVVGPAILSSFENLSRSVSTAFADMLTGAASFKDGFVEIWRSLQRSVSNVLSSILDSFINTFLKGLTGAMQGQQGAMSSAFGAMFAGASGGAQRFGSVLADGSGSVALSAAGGAGSAAAGTATIGGAVTAGLATAGIGLAIAGIAFGIKQALSHAGRDLVESFAQEHGGFDALHTQLLTLGDEGEQMWIKITQGVNKRDKKAAQQAIDDVTAALERQEAAADKAAEAAKKLADAAAAIGGATGKVATGATAAFDAAFQRMTGLTAEEAAATTALLNDQDHEWTDAEKKRLDTVRAANGQIVVDYQDQFDRVSRISLASFNAYIQQGHTAVEAIEEVGPAIDALAGSADRFGFAGNAAFAELSRWRELTTANAPLLDQVGGLTQLMTSMQTLGALTVETFADLQAQGVASFQALTDAGFTQTEALTQMKPLLEAIRQQHIDSGMAIDDNTQKLIDQAEEQGILGEAQQSTAQVLKDGLGSIITLLGGQLPDAWKAAAKAGKTAAEEIAIKAAESARDAARRVAESFDGLSFDVPINFLTNNVEISGVVSGDAVRDGVNSFRDGTHGEYRDFGNGTPVMLHGRERITPWDERSPSGRPLQVTVISQMDGREVGRGVSRFIPADLINSGY